jgi:PKD repeat protein
MDNDCTTSSDGTTLTHEFGHHLNLIHTHGPQNGTLTNELVSGINCSSAGDLLCDTPADPQLNNSNVNNVNCLYSVSGPPPTDAQGFLFDPDTSNIMSYAPQACTNTLSDEQYARMYAGYHAFKNYYACPSLNVDFISEENAIDCGEQLVVTFNDNSTNAIYWEWDVNGDDVIDYTESNFSHTYESPGNYDVSLTISDGSETITKVFPNYVNFITNTYETSKIYLNLKISDGINQNSWEFKDSSGIILFSQGPYSSPGYYQYEFETGLDCYTFTIYDSAGDGLTNDNFQFGSEAYGTEFYELLDDNETIIVEGREFGFEESTLIQNQFLNINETIQLNSFIIYPNPASNHINIRGNYLAEKYSIHDINGKLVLKNNIQKESDLKVSVDKLSAGLYFITIQKNSFYEIIKFVKN